MPYEDIVKGYEITPDRYVLISSEELEALDPKATRTIDIEEFVDLAEIDPIYYDHSYYLAPAAGGAKAYRLLVDAMRESGKVGDRPRGAALQAAAVRAAAQRRGADAEHDAVRATRCVAPDRLDELDGVEEAEASERELTDGPAADRVAVGRVRARPSTTTSTASACST